MYGRKYLGGLDLLEAKRGNMVMRLIWLINDINKLRYFLVLQELNHKLHTLDLLVDSSTVWPIFFEQFQSSEAKL